MSADVRCFVIVFSHQPIQQPDLINLTKFAVQDHYTKQNICAKNCPRNLL